MSIDWIYTRYTPIVRVFVKIRNLEKYVVRINKSRFSDISMLIRYFWEQFALEFSKDYMLIQEPDLIITDPISIINDSELKLMKVKDYVKFKSQERNLNLSWFIVKKMQTLTHEWRIAMINSLNKINLKKVHTRPKYAVDHLVKSDFVKEFKVYESLKNNDLIDFKPSIFKKKTKIKGVNKSMIEWQNGTASDSRVIKPIGLPKFWDNNYSSKQFVLNTLEILTPDFEDFISQIIYAKSYEDLGQIVRILSMLKGFRTIYPRGSKYEDILFLCHKTGKRKGVKTTKRTGWEFKLIYYPTPDKKGYFLYKYVATHNHHLWTEDVFMGEYAKKKLDYLTNELKIAWTDTNRKDVLKEKLNEPVDLREECNLDQEYDDYKNGLLELEDLWVLRPVKRCIYNRKVTRIDEIWKTLAFQEFNERDVHNIDKDGELSRESEANVYTNIRTYKYSTDIFSRHLEILKYAQQFELNLLSVLYNQSYEHQILEDENKGVESYLVSNADKLINNRKIKITEIPNPLLENEKVKSKYSKLQQISVEISPYRIYEVSDEWNNAYDGNPLHLLTDAMQLYEIEVESQKEIINRKRERIEVNFENLTNSSYSDINEKKSDSNNKYSQSSYSNSVSIIEQISENSKMNEIIDEVNNDIINDIDGIEANNTFKLKRKRENKEETKRDFDRMPDQDDYNQIDQHFAVADNENINEKCSKTQHDQYETLDIIYKD